MILVTSLASFRSDLNIVHVPNGDVLAIRDDIYVSVNLQRLGASGRSALNLDEPGLVFFSIYFCPLFLIIVRSASSKEKFLQMYGIPEPNTSDNNKAWFTETVLELVRMVQAALSLFGMFSLAADERDGLICDSTVDGMQRWADNIGISLRLEVRNSVSLIVVCVVTRIFVAHGQGT